MEVTEMSEQEFNKIFARNLNAMLDRRGLTQVDIANALGVTESSVSLWCNGKNTPRMSKVDKLCTLLRCTRSALLTENGPQIADEADRAAAMQRIYDKGRILFDAAEDATPEELEKAAQYIEFLKTQR